MLGDWNLEIVCFWTRVGVDKRVVVDWVVDIEATGVFGVCNNVKAPLYL